MRVDSGMCCGGVYEKVACEVLDDGDGGVCVRTVRQMCNVEVWFV